MNSNVIFQDEISHEQDSQLLELIEKLKEPCFVTDHGLSILSVNRHLQVKLGPNCLKAFLGRIVSQLHSPDASHKKFETILIMKDQLCGVFQINKVPFGNKCIWILKESTSEKKDPHLALSHLYYENLIKKILQNSNQLMVTFDTQGNCLGVIDPDNNDRISAEISDLEKIFDGHLKKENIPIWLFQLKASPLSEDELLALVPDEILIKGHRFNVTSYVCREEEHRHKLVMLLKKK